MSNAGNFKEEKDHHFFGFYKGRVESNGYGKNFDGTTSTSDTVNRSRVRVRVIGQHSFDTQDDEFIPIKNLPNAEQAGSMMGGFGPSKSGITQLPEVGSWMWIFFENGNCNRPVYFASVIGDNDITDQNQYLTKFKTRSGAIISINDNINNDDQNLDCEISIKTIKNSELLISDKTNNEKIYLKAGKSGSQILVDDASKIIKIDDKNNNSSIEMNSTDIILNSGAKIQIKNSSTGLKAKMEELWVAINDVYTKMAGINTVGAPPSHFINPAQQVLMQAEATKANVSKESLSLLLD